MDFETCQANTVFFVNLLNTLLLIFLQKTSNKYFGVILYENLFRLIMKV